MTVNIYIYIYIYTHTHTHAHTYLVGLGSLRPYAYLRLPRRTESESQGPRNMKFKQIIFIGTKAGSQRRLQGFQHKHLFSKGSPATDLTLDARLGTQSILANLSEAATTVP